MGHEAVGCQVVGLIRLDGVRTGDMRRCDIRWCGYIRLGDVRRCGMRRGRSEAMHCQTMQCEAGGAV